MACVPSDRMMVFTSAISPPDDMINWNPQFLPNCSEIRYFNDEQMRISALSIAETLEKENVVPGAASAFKLLRLMARWISPNRFQRNESGKSPNTLYN